VNASPVLTVTADRLNICRNETVNISASGANTYSWSTSATTPSISLTPTTVTNLILTVVGTSTASCESTGTIQIKVNSCNGLTEVSGGSAFEVFPNPNDGKFTLRANHSLNLTVVNSLGQVIQTVSLTEANAFETELTGLSSGVYFIRTDFDNSILTKKIIIRN
jgi:exo-beta-1,3-glucanase (GH17 family)